MGRHGGLGDLQGLTEGGDLEHVEPGAQEQVGELDGLLLQLGRLGGRGGGGDGGGHDFCGCCDKGALTKGVGCFFAGERRRGWCEKRGGLADKTGFIGREGVRDQTVRRRRNEMMCVSTAVESHRAKKGISTDDGKQVMNSESAREMALTCTCYRLRLVQCGFEASGPPGTGQGGAA